MLRVNIVVALVVVGHCCGMHVKCWRQLLFCLHVECSDVCVLVSHFSFWLMFAGVVMSVESEVPDFENEPTAFVQELDNVCMSLPVADSPHAMQLRTPARARPAAEMPLLCSPMSSDAGSPVAETPPKRLRLRQRTTPPPEACSVAQPVQSAAEEFV